MHYTPCIPKQLDSMDKHTYHIKPYQAGFSNTVHITSIVREPPMKSAMFHGEITMTSAPGEQEPEAKRPRVEEARNWRESSVDMGW